MRLSLSMFLNFSVMPLRFGAPLRLRLGALGAFLGYRHRRGPSSQAASRLGVADGGGSVLAGVQLIVLGLIGDIFGRLFLAANRKPQFLVRGVESSRGGGAELDAALEVHEVGGPAAPPAGSRT